MTNLSPQAQAVMTAAINDNTDIINNYSCDWIQGYSRQIAAALRAATDQVVPEPNNLDKEIFSIAAMRVRWAIRDQFLAIATELESQQ